MRVLLVEDEEDIGQAIKRTLMQEGYVVDWTIDAETAWSYLTSPEIEYRVGIVDWMLPGLSGVDFIRQLRQNQYTLPLLLLTAKDSMEDRVHGLDAGADDYLMKPFGMAELLARLRALQRRSPCLQAPQYQAGALTLDYGASTVSFTDQTGQPQKVLLTAKEFLLLEFFARHPKQIINRDRLLNQLWEAEAEPSSNVVAAQIRLLRRKLAQYHCPVSIETLYGLG
ncbi:MAG: response regulator transcription factor [Kamptonema sp. SIO4C4]|nr:response regulator transcription factor [Kamptonema sp. SIO4C4]